MPLRADRRTLHRVLAILARVADPKASMPILGTVRLAAAPNATEATLTATDLTTTLSATAPIEANGGGIDTCLDARTLARLLKPEGRKGAAEVVLEPLDGHGVAVSLDAMTTKLPGVDQQDFPTAVGHDIPDDLWTHAALWPAAELRDALAYATPAASRDTTRPHLCCVAIDPAKGVIVATDGHRLHKVATPAPWHGPQVLVPTAAAELLERILGEDELVALAIAQGILRVRHGRWTLTTKLVDAQFPPYEMVIPRTDDALIRLSVEATKLVAALTRVARATRCHSARFKVNGAISISSWSDDAGEAELAVPALESTHHGGDDLVISLDTRYLRDALGGAATAELRFGGDLDPVRVDVGERVGVIMPLRG
jgi:DNA polymerase-3 subunit beta